MADNTPMSVNAKPLTIAFYVAFALWFTAMSYSGLGFYRWFIHPLVEGLFGLILWAILIAVLVAVVRRSVFLASLPWSELVTFSSAFAVFNLLWRLSPHSWDAFKITSLVVDIATPIIGAIGVAALVGEWRRAEQLSA